MIRCPRNLVPGRQQGNHVAKSSVLQPHPVYNTNLMLPPKNIQQLKMPITPTRSPNSEKLAGITSYWAQMTNTKETRPRYIQWHSWHHNHCHHFQGTTSANMALWARLVTGPFQSCSGTNDLTFLQSQNLCSYSRQLNFSLVISSMFRWRASLWKTVWRELLVYLGLYMAISLIYRQLVCQLIDFMGLYMGYSLFRCASTF